MFKPFNGSVDELLDHVDSQINPEDVENIVVNKTEDVLLDNDTAIQLIMSEADCNIEMAQTLLDEMKREEITKVLNNLVESGLIEVVKYDEDGEKMYGLTENGSVIAKQLLSKKE